MKSLIFKNWMINFALGKTKHYIHLELELALFGTNRKIWRQSNEKGSVINDITNHVDVEVESLHH